MISILMPVFNAAPFLEECLESIIRQSHAEWELIAIDDFSTDNSLTILREYAQRDPRIKVRENIEKGIIPALRLAYADSLGSHITRMDADDIMPPTKLDSLISACRIGGVVTGKVEYFRSDGALGDGYRRYADWLNGLVDQESHWNEIYKECVIPSPAWMMDKQTFEQIGAFDSDTYPEDYDLVFRMYGADLSIIGLDEIIHQWRDHKSRASRNDPKYLDNRFLDLKLHHFLSLDHDADRPLAIWGAGTKGKYVARQLASFRTAYTWHTDNLRKQGKDIDGSILSAPSEIPKDAQVLLTMASPDDQKEVILWLESREDLSSFWLV